MDVQTVVVLVLGVAMFIIALLGLTVELIKLARK